MITFAIGASGAAAARRGAARSALDTLALTV
jgi:hypothetical protein